MGNEARLQSILYRMVQPPLNVFSIVLAEMFLRLDVEINTGYGDGGFSLNGSGLISNNPEWRGWLGIQDSSLNFSIHL